MTQLVDNKGVRAQAAGAAMAGTAFAALLLAGLRRHRLAVAALVVLIIGVAALAVANSMIKPGPDAHMAVVARRTGGFTETSFHRYAQGLPANVLAVADRHAPGPFADLWGRPVGWANLDLRQPPSLGFGTLNNEDARAINALIPVVGSDVEAARPFVLNSKGAERERAVKCLTQAIYYEAALEPTEGQAAVAQVVLNRMRHPSYPKTICGVVYQGAERFTGCQFSFTCDGSVLRAPQTSYWDRAKLVAERALAGYVQPQVGTATFYHADYVFPAWGPMLVKLNQIGAHIFYRFPGPPGSVRAFAGRYAGNELGVSLQVHNPADGPVDEAPAPPGFETFTIAQAQTGAPVDANGRVRGVIAGRRTPTPEEIARINAALGAMPESRSEPVAPVAKPPAGAKTAPATTSSDITPIGQR